MTHPIDTEYPMKRLKHLVTLRRSHDAGREREQQYVGLENIESWTGKLVGETARSEGTMSPLPNELLSNGFERGDVLFGKLRPYLAKAWVAEFSGSCTTEALVMEPHSIEPRFLYNVCLSPAFIEAVDASTFGSRMPRADWSFIGNMPIPVPEQVTQVAIADYLDRETVQLDTLVTAKKRLLDLLAEKRQTMVTHMVTRGIDAHVPMKDAGVPWLGDIPAHWQTERARWLFRERDQRSDDGTEELLTVSHLTGVTPRSEKDVNMFEAETLEGYKLCKGGDLVINTLWAWMGAMGVSSVQGVVSPSYHVYEPTERMDPGYVDVLSRIPVFAQEVVRHSKGVWSSRLRLYPDGFFNIHLPVPPLSEQQKIAAFIEIKCKKLDDLGAATTRTIELLRERRAALISAAVTGDIAVGDDTEAST